VPTIRLHDLRHTHASMALASGVHLKVMQERLGHSSISVTADLYSHVAPGLQRDAANEIATQALGSWRPAFPNRSQTGVEKTFEGKPEEASSQVSGGAPEGIRTPNLLIRSRVSAVTSAFAGVRTAGHVHSARPQPSPRVRRRTPALLSELLSIDQASTSERDRPMAPSIEGMLDPAAQRGSSTAVRSFLPGRWAAAVQPRRPHSHGTGVQAAPPGTIRTDRPHPRHPRPGWRPHRQNRRTRLPHPTPSTTATSRTPPDFSPKSIRKPCLSGSRETPAVDLHPCRARLDS
jgi:hypothetical protein